MSFNAELLENSKGNGLNCKQIRCFMLVCGLNNFIKKKMVRKLWKCWLKLDLQSFAKKNDYYDQSLI